MADCYCDYDGPSVWNSTEPVARVEHECYECRCTILPGEKYEYVWGIWDYPETFKTCPRCLALRKWVLAHVPCFCWSHGGLLEEARDTIDHYQNECEGLWFGFLRRHHVITKYRDNQRKARAP